MRIDSSLSESEYQGVSNRGDIIRGVNSYGNTLIKGAHVGAVQLRSDTCFAQSHFDTRCQAAHNCFGGGVQRDILTRVLTKSIRQRLNLVVREYWGHLSLFCHRTLLLLEGMSEVRRLLVCFRQCCFSSSRRRGVRRNLTAKFQIFVFSIYSFIVGLLSFLVRNGGVGLRLSDFHIRITHRDLEQSILFRVKGLRFVHNDDG